MRFYMPEWQSLAQNFRKRLKFDAECVICARPGPQSLDLCNDCESLLQRCLHTDASGYVSHLCLTCGEELAGACVELCNDCRQCESAFTRIVAPYRYAFPLDRLLHSQKYGDKRVLGRIFGELLASSVKSATRPDSVLPTRLIPVPLHANRRQLRGYNQSADIARWCARELGLQSSSHAVSRLFDTGSLAGLSRAERQYRILGAFRADDSVAGQHLAIVDDVLTTGSTARELARELYDTGAASVELWVLARTSRDR